MGLDFCVCTYRVKMGQSPLNVAEWESVLGKMLRYHDNISKEIGTMVIEIKTQMKSELVPVAEDRASGTGRRPLWTTSRRPTMRRSVVWRPWLSSALLSLPPSLPPPPPQLRVKRRRRRLPLLRLNPRQLSTLPQHLLLLPLPHKTCETRAQDQ